MSMTQIDSARDVVSFLKSQHEQIKAGFEQVLASTGDDREEAFVHLRRLLAVHETAEEEIVHPRAKREIANGDAVVDARLKEEHEAKETLSELEKLDVASPEFETKLRTLQADVLEHAEAEEHQEFDKLESELDDDQLERMRKAVALAEKMAPTRPHAGVESAGANMMAGPFAMMLDRARDAISGKG
ncbi:MAG TPA: hemerythrin domain-containing protein [Jatrophihabitantaceae bacterium]|nr:hemerythrin domain-containing protein [Jatrophihabitantaceae bacterium]